MNSFTSCESQRPLASPDIVLREEFEDWALLFSPASGKMYGIGPVGIFVWKRLDGAHTVDDIVCDMEKFFLDVPEESVTQVCLFVQCLKDQGFLS